MWLEWLGFYADDNLLEPQIVVRDRTVLDANQPAQRCGIRVGMTAQEARNVTPEIVCKPWRQEEYADRQKAWLDLCLPFCSRIEPLDAHIAAIDLSDHPRPREIAERLAETLVQTVGLPLRAGAGPSKWIAELAARDHDFHRAMYNSASFLSSRPVEDLTPIEPSHRQRLSFLGYRTVGDVARLTLATLQAQFGEAGLRVFQAARGTLADPVVARYPVDAASATLSFDGSPDTAQALMEGFARLASELAGSLMMRNAASKRVELTLDHEEGKPTTVIRTFTRSLATERDLMGALCLMLQEPPERPVERARILLPDLHRVQQVQLELGDRRARTDAETSLRAAVQNMRTSFGDLAVQRGSDVGSPRWQGVRRAYRDAFGWTWM